MSTFHARVEELLELPQEIVGNEALALLEQIREWPTTTQVSLERVAYLIAALLQEPDPTVRRVRVSESITLRDPIG